MWNYRIINHGDYYALHEVFYDDDGTPVTYCERAEITGKTVDEIGQYLKQMTKDYTKGKKKVLTEKDFAFDKMQAWLNRE